MNLTGTRSLPQDPATVWAHLFDRDTLAASIPGCEQLEAAGENGFAAVVRVKVGPVAARFKGEVEIGDIDAPRSCTLAGKGNGGIAGFAKGTARVTLSPEAGGGTRLDYVADAQLGGKLAALGSRLIASSAQKLSDEFFDRFAAALRGEMPGAADAADGET